MYWVECLLKNIYVCALSKQKFFAAGAVSLQKVPI